MQRKHDISLSVVLPVFNEAKNLPILLDRLTATLADLKVSYEIVAVDDGSKDDSFEVLKGLRAKEPRLKIVHFQCNFGQTAALSAGIEHAQGDIIVTIDSDLENDPKDIARLLAKMDEGYDVVSGWRRDRWQGSFFTRKVPSVAANWLISKLTGVYLHDYGCTLKAYRSDVIKGVRLYGEMHRFIPAYAAWQGGRVAELPVSYAPRLHGKSNYGFGRMPRVLLDLVVIVFLHRYMNRPMHFFGGWGLLSLSGGIFAGFAALALRVLGIKHIVDTPLPVLSALLIIVGVQLVLFGVIGEMLMRTYYESQGNRPYRIKEVVFE
ncbi:MAG TPA: glycosyltransferase family 2 protein [Candidatus Paceibacterota bacterium]